MWHNESVDGSAETELKWTGTSDCAGRLKERGMVLGLEPSYERPVTNVPIHMAEERIFRGSLA